MTDGNFTGASSVGFGIELTPDRPITEIADLAAHAETSGIDTVFVSNHFDNRDPFQTLGAIGRRTDRISLGPGVVNPVETHPVRIATQTATLAESTPGRVICGVGAGDRSTLSKLDLSRDRPVARVADAVETVRGLTGGEPLETGRVHDVGGVALSYTPVNGPIPVYVGAQGPTMLRMAAELADGVLVNAAHPADYRACLASIDDGQRGRSADIGDVDVVAFACVSVAETTDAARKAARAPVAFVAAGAPDRVVDRHGIDPASLDSIRGALAAGDHADAYRAVTPAMIDAFAVVGTADRVTDRLRSIGEYVDAVVAGAPLGPDRQHAIELLGTVADDLFQEPVIDG